MDYYDDCENFSGSKLLLVSLQASIDLTIMKCAMLNCVAMVRFLLNVSKFINR